MAAQAPAAASISDDAIAYLTPLVASAPSTDTLVKKLAGSTASFLQEQADPRVAALYLAAAARHIPSTDPEGDNLSRERLEIVEAVGAAAARCTPRSTISQSGILPALQGWMKPEGSLTPAHVEFLQCCILAAQYRYARRIVGDDWPRPMKASRTFVEQNALRYYYLRGLVHMGCKEWQLAIRSFWTALSVPIDDVSSISVAAWKKLVLCQCLLERPVALPASTSPAVSRFVTTPAEGDTQNIRAYLDLVKACTTETDKFAATATQYQPVFQEDGNAGMVERLAVALLHRRVLHLAKIYSVVSTSQLSHELQVPPDQLPTLLSQVDHLEATIEPDGMVSLERTTTEPVPAESLEALMDLTEKIRKLDVAVSSSLQYQRVRPMRSGRGPRGVEEFS